MRIFGLIGYPLTHSFSKNYFENKFRKESIDNAVYENFPLESIELLPGLLNHNPSLKGLNVTIPYKESVLGYLDHLDNTASKIGAVNTIKVQRDNNNILLSGYNTDEYGFRKSLRPYLKTGHRKALILGTGGAAKAVKYVLEEMGIPYVSVSRKTGNSCYLHYSSLDREIVQAHQLIINTTPLGMYPDVEGCPDIPYKDLTPKHLLFDLVYNPETTQFMQKGQEAGAVTLNGKRMLEYQAEKAWEIWNPK
ncbi:MAG: shikimate dehydrogenase [Bacteroidales bacterium]|nr:MAG: shikimate dehydrogenase [Bacteroidales bacterium]